MDAVRCLPLLACALVGCAFDPSGVETDERAPDAASPDGEPAARVPAGYQAVSGQPAWYRAVDIGTPLALAALDCDDDDAFAHLVVVDDAAENAALRLFADRELGGARVWLGITDEAREGQWRTVDGLGVDHVDWKDGEPNDAWPGEDCAEMLGDEDPPGMQGLWNDTSCSELRPYVCEWRP